MCVCQTYTPKPPPFYGLRKAEGMRRAEGHAYPADCGRRAGLLKEPSAAGLPARHCAETSFLVSGGVLVLLSRRAALPSVPRPPAILCGVK